MGTFGGFCISYLQHINRTARIYGVPLAVLAALTPKRSSPSCRYVLTEMMRQRSRTHRKGRRLCSTYCICFIRSFNYYASAPHHCSRYYSGFCHSSIFPSRTCTYISFFPIEQLSYYSDTKPGSKKQLHDTQMFRRRVCQTTEVSS